MSENGKQNSVGVFWKNLQKKWYFKTLRCIILALFILLLLGYAFMERILFPAPKAEKKAGNITLQSGNARLDALWLPKENARNVILYSHGNGEHLAMIKPFLQEFVKHDYSVLAYDYAGYGASTGKAGEKQAYLDVETAYRYLTEKENIPPGKIIIAGYSVGSGASSYIATEYPVKALVLIAPFASAIQVVLPFSLPFDRFPNAERLKNKAVPVTVFHGTSDGIVPYRNGKTIFKKASGKKKLITIPGAGHASIFPAISETLWQELEKL